jgi:hypothetical protein
MTTLTLPTPAMELITSYLDSKDLATMAQVNTSWKTLVYRNSTWKKHLWKPKTGSETLWYTNIPTLARHCGAPRKDCFLSWAKTTLADSSLGLKPDALFMRWKSLGKPCVHLTHHHMWDVCKATPQLKTMPASESTYYSYRLISVFTKPGLNDYIAYLMREVDLLTKEHYFVLTMMTSDYLRDLRLLCHKAKQDEYAEIAKLVLERRKVLEACVRALQSHGVVEFDTNDSYVKNNLEKAYSLAAFSMPAKN